MKVLITNLIKNDKNNNIVEKIKEEYEKTSDEMEIKVLDYSEESFKDCIGCWSCWVKTPGVCLYKDVMIDFYSEYLKSDRAVLLLDTSQGFITGNNKAFIDRLIPLYHPYIDIINGEMMHKYRYEKYPELDFYIGNNDLNEEEECVIEDYLFRLAYHFRVSARRIEEDDNGFRIKNLDYRSAKSEFIKKESSKDNRGKVIIYNGSPRGLKANSLILAEEIANGLKEEGLKETDYEIRNLYQQSSHKLWAEDFENHSRHIFVFPLYVHAMPSIVMKFFEQLQPCNNKIQITFVVQSGFAESSQSHYLRPYLSLLVKRLGAVYGGTIIKPGIEGIQMGPRERNKKLFEKINKIGNEIIKKGIVSDELIDELAQPVHLKKSVILLFRIIALTGLTNLYWDMQLKKNGVYEERFNKSYAKMI